MPWDEESSIVLLASAAAHFRSDAGQQVDLRLKVVALPLRHVQMVLTFVHVVLY